VRGVPTVRVGSRLFYGDDRLEAVKALLSATELPCVARAFGCAKPVRVTGYSVLRAAEAL
jgi:hypothetical protein